MEKIQNISRFFKWLFQLVLVGYVLMIAVFVIFWMNAPHPIAIHDGKTAFDLGLIPAGIPILKPLTLSAKIAGFCVSMMPLLFDVFIIWQLIRLFRLYSQGQVFQLDNVRLIRKIGILVLFRQVLISPLYDLLMSLTLTWHNPPGHHMAEVTFSGLNLGLTLSAILIILISWIMAEGMKLQEEHDYTI